MSEVGGIDRRPVAPGLLGMCERAQQRDPPGQIHGITAAGEFVAAAPFRCEWAPWKGAYLVRRGDGMRRRVETDGLALLATATTQRRPVTVVDMQQMLGFPAAPARHVLSEGRVAKGWGTARAGSTEPHCVTSRSTDAGAVSPVVAEAGATEVEHAGLATHAHGELLTRFVPGAVEGARGIIVRIHG